MIVQYNQHFLKKIPAGAEASNILVGDVDCLTTPLYAFIRLQKATLFDDITEVPVPTRFMFILLGPPGDHQKNHEIGRSIATLMSDEVSCDLCHCDFNAKLYRLFTYAADQPAKLIVW